MIFKLCYLFTFVTSMMNLLGVTDLQWKLVFMPSIVAILINIIILIVCFVIAMKN